MHPSLPATFEIFADEVLRGDKANVHWMVVIYSKSAAGHAKHLAMVIQCLVKHELLQYATLSRACLLTLSHGSFTKLSPAILAVAFQHPAPQLSRFACRGNSDRQSIRG